MSELTLVDTSAWTRFFRKKPDSPATADEVERLLVENSACCTQPVFLELVVGSGGSQGVKELESDFSALQLLKAGESEWQRALQIAAALRRKGLRVDIVDLVVAATATINKVRLLHHDKHFRQIASVSDLREYSYLSGK
jgi:predicted nucleic acid-binding protein